jgi:hypothetical protein
MKTNHIINGRKVGGDYFMISFSRTSNTPLSEYLTKFNPEDYFIVKSPRNQKVISYEELLQFKYSQYAFFRKNVYNINNILQWCNFISFQYLSKPTPPFSPNKIIIKQ